MRALNEPIARRANREDGCSGRFWEGRYKCQALLDDAAVLACMSYVDLNPIRAGIAEDLVSSMHTGAARRIDSLRSKTPQANADLTALRTSIPAYPLALTTGVYLELIDWTAGLLRPDKRGAVAPGTPLILDQLGVGERQWHFQVLGIESRYYRAIGCAHALIEKAKTMGQCWLKGLGTAQRLKQEAV